MSAGPSSDTVTGERHQDSSATEDSAPSPGDQTAAPRRKRRYVPKTKGCFECSKRRINCDRTTPECVKCVFKGISCSGLRQNYTFVDGFASGRTVTRKRRDSSFTDFTTPDPLCPQYDPSLESSVDAMFYDPNNFNNVDSWTIKPETDNLVPACSTSLPEFTAAVPQNFEPCTDFYPNMPTSSRFDVGQETTVQETEPPHNPSYPDPHQLPFTMESQPVDDAPPNQDWSTMALEDWWQTPH